MSPQQQKGLVRDLWKGLDILDSKERKLLLQLLLTHTETKMLSKRLAALKLLQKKESYFQIGEKLKLTPTTINRLSNILQRYDDSLPKILFRLS